MTQPWEFLGYQKINANASQIQFNNVYTAANPVYNNISFKLVAECMTYNETDIMETNAPYYQIKTNLTSGSNNWDYFYYGQYDTNSASGGNKQWANNGSGNYNQSGAFTIPNSWPMTKGSLSYQRRYSSTEDNLQWGTYEVEWMKMQGNRDILTMKGFNTVSRTNSTTMFNQQICSAASNGSTSQPSNISWFALNYTFLAGSKFWMWAMRDTNSF